MGKHAEWRKLVKKLRRKRIRSVRAQERDAIEEAERVRREKSPTYQAWLEEQKVLEEHRVQEEERLKKEENEKWLRAEAEGKKKWEFLSRKLANAREERSRQQALIKAEWEAERQKLKEIEEQKLKELEEKIARDKVLREEIDHYIENGGELPEQFVGSLETNPNKELCPFFKKTATCRFGDGCSRNHIRPKISCCLLFRNFYTHISLNQTENEHGSDILEYDTKEIYNHFKEFFYDVLPEAEKYGRVKYFRVCCNKELHLRGNVYIEYSNPREAIKAYRSLQGRWYGGKQLNVEFCNIASWKSAICGLFFKRSCPKGSACNFLHIFRNPGDYYAHIDKERDEKNRYQYENKNENSFNIDDSSRNWRWSESPERFNYQENVNNGEHKRKYRSRSKSRQRLKSRRRSKSKSRSKERSRKYSKSNLDRHSSSRSHKSYQNDKESRKKKLRKRDKSKS
nr:U2 small nuclear ribonucleoprotein auxiliary factor 35 kDa subunit-related protein 2 [Onthophagus taurus]